LIVTAVGCRGCCFVAADARAASSASVNGDAGSGTLPTSSSTCGMSAPGSGWITVPPPRGFSTFLMRMGIFRRIACN
jgi:hypothetical protein